MSTLKDCQKLPQAEREVWEGGFIKLPSWVLDENEKLFRPVMTIWIDLQSGMIIGHELGQKQSAPKFFLKQLLSAMARPQMGAPRRPTHLCLKDVALAEELRAPLASLGITVEVIDRFIAIDKVVGMMMTSMDKEEGNKTMPALTRVNGVTHEYAEFFFRTAADFYRQAPWRFVSDGVPIQVECPHFFHSPLYFVVMGSGGVEFGLGLFVTLEEIATLYAVGVPPGRQVPDIRTASLLFSDPTYIAFEDLDAVEQNNWELANPEAVPHVFKISPKRKPALRPPSFALVQAFEAGMLALPDFILKNKTKIKNGKACTTEVVVETYHGPWPLRLNAPPSELLF